MMLRSNFIFSHKEEIVHMVEQVSLVLLVETRRKTEEIKDNPIIQELMLKEEWRPQELVIRDMRVQIIKPSIKRLSTKRWGERMKLANNSLWTIQMLSKCLERCINKIITCKTRCTKNIKGKITNSRRFQWTGLIEKVRDLQTMIITLTNKDNLLKISNNIMQEMMITLIITKSHLHLKKLEVVLW